MRDFEPFFAAAEALGAAVFVHALASLITGGTLLGHPGLRLAFSHGGGAFGLVLPRLMHGWRSSPALADAVPRSPLQLARGLYYDTLIYDRDTLRFLIERFGITQLCIGTNHPFRSRRCTRSNRSRRWRLVRASGTCCCRPTRGGSSASNPRRRTGPMRQLDSDARSANG